MAILQCNAGCFPPALWIVASFRSGIGNFQTTVRQSVTSGENATSHIVRHRASGYFIQINFVRSNQTQQACCHVHLRWAHIICHGSTDTSAMLQCTAYQHQVRAPSRARRCAAPALSTRCSFLMFVLRRWLSFGVRIVRVHASPRGHPELDDAKRMPTICAAAANQYGAE